MPKTTRTISDKPNSINMLTQSTLTNETKNVRYILLIQLLMIFVLCACILTVEMSTLKATLVNEKQLNDTNLKYQCKILT